MSRTHVSQETNFVKFDEV